MADNLGVVHPVKVEPRPGFRLGVVFSDGVAGEIDLSGDVGRGVFAPLADPEFFARVRLGEGRRICWSAEIDICPDAAYLEITAHHQPEPAHA
jgi:hypothetical protein